MLKSYIQWVTTLSMMIRVYLLAIVASQICEIPQNSPKIWTYSKVHGHPRSSILVSRLTLDVSATVFEILTHFAACFPHQPLFDAS